MYADVILPLSLPQVLTYGVPDGMQDEIRPGMRVEVALGKNKLYAGVVDSVHSYKPEHYQVKPIRAIIDAEPVVNDIQLRMWRWIAKYYLSAPGEVMQAALPAHLKLMSETRIEWVGHEDVLYQWSDRTFAVVDALVLRKALTMTELRELAGVQYVATVLHELLEQEVIWINDALETTYKPRKEKVVRLADRYQHEPELVALFKDLERAPRQMSLVMAWVELDRKEGVARQAELLERAQASQAQLKALCDKGVFVVSEVNVDRLFKEDVANKKEVQFTPVQETAWKKLEEGLMQKPVALLHGVTGSGKTLLYIHKIRQCVASGRPAVLMVPEIALTTQLVSRLHAYFGDKLGVYHSHFTNNERVEIWEKVRTGRYTVVVGPRSVLWLPYADLGLIIVDEEHDTSYKQRDPAPRFHARDTAIFLASLFQAKTILGSATPSVETLYNVQQTRYAYVPLKDRYMGVEMPRIEVVNARTAESAQKQGSGLITPALRDAILETLAQGKQAILFQNKRGYTPFLMCTSCGWVPQCNNCSVSLTYHKSTDKLHCHYCGQRSAVISTCPACGHNRLASKSFGTERIEEEVQGLFPKARVARMDVDSMRSKNAMQELLGKLEQGKVDILVGTQMVVKGLDLASVALVGVLSADSLLSYPDFRVNERAFQLMEQVSGRSGRVDGRGRVIIQAYQGQHPVLQWVKDHDIQGFYRSEIRHREQFAYPPFTRLIKISFRHKDETRAITGAQDMATMLLPHKEFSLQGPGPAVVNRVRNQYIQEIWLKMPRDPKTLEQVKDLLRETRQQLLARRGYSALGVVFDVDPS